MAPSGRKKGKEVDRSPASILKHGDYTVSLTSWLAGGPAVLGKKPRRVLDLKVERDRKSEKSDQSLVLARKKDNGAAASDLEVGTSGSEGALMHTSRQRRQTEGSSQPVVSSRPFLTYEEERVEKFTIRPPPVVFNTPEDVPTGWLETILNQRKNGESSKAVPKKAISYEHSDSEEYEAGYDSPPHSKSKSLPKKSSSSSRKASEIRIKTKCSSKKGTREVEVTTADATDESSSDVESLRPTKTKKIDHRSKTRERRKTKKIQANSSDEETADDATADSESSDIESTDIELRSKPKSKKKPSASSKKAGSSKVKVEKRDRKGKRKVVVEASSEGEISSDESMTDAESSPPKKVKNKNRVTVTETTRKGKRNIVTVESSDEADTTHVKSRSSTKGKKSEVQIKASGKAKTKKVTFETTDEAEITDDATTDAEPMPSKAHKGKGKIKTKAIDKGKTKAKKKVEVESSDPAETTDAVTTEDATQTEAETTEAATTEAETTDAETTVAEKPKATPVGKANDGWTPSLDAIILGMKEGGQSWASIGNATGRNKNEVKKRHQELVGKGVVQVNKGNHNNNKKAQKAQNKENKNNDKNDASSSQTAAAEETSGFGGFGDFPGFGADQDDSNNNDNNGDSCGGGGDQNNNNNDNNNGGGGDGAWGSGNQNNNKGGGDVGPGFDTPAWGADCTGGGDQATNNNNNDTNNNDTNNDNNNGFGDAGWGGGDQDNNGGGNVGPGPGDCWNADCTGGDKPPSNAGSKKGSNQGKPPSNKPPSNNGRGGGSNQGNRPPSNSGNNGWGGGSNQGNKPPSNSGGNNGGSNQGNKPPSNKPPSNNGDWGNVGPTQGNKPPSNNGDWGGVGPTQDNNGGWGSGSNQGNKPPSNSGGWNNGGSNQGNRPPSNKPPSNNGDRGSGSNQGNNTNTKPPSNNGGSARGSNHGRPPSNNGGWGSGSNSGNKPPSNNGDWDGGSNQGNKPPSNSGGWNNGGSDQGDKPPSNNGGWGSGSHQGNNNNTKPPSNSGSNRGSGSQQGDPKAKSMEKELSIRDQEIKALKERVSEEKLQRLDAEVFALKLQNSANRLNQNKQPEDGMGWNTGGSDNNWGPPSAAGSTRSNKQPDNGTGWKSGPSPGEVWSVAPNPDYKLPSNSGWVPKDFVPPQGNKPPSNNNAPPGSPDGWIYGSPTESERKDVAERVETWKGSISPLKEQGRWGTPDGGWPATPVTVSRRRENMPDNTRGRSPAARSASAKDWKQGLTRVDEEPDKGYDMWKKPPSNNGKPGSNAGRNSPGNFNNSQPSGEQYGWNSGPDAAAGNGTGWGGGADRVSTPSFEPAENNDWTGGNTRNGKPPSNKPPGNKPPSNNGDWTPGLGGTGWKADCTKPPSNSGWGGGSNQGKDNNKPPSNVGSARGSNHGKPPSNNGDWNAAPAGGNSKKSNKVPGRNEKSFSTGNLPRAPPTWEPPAWGADCTGPWNGKQPAEHKASKGDDQNALNIHTVTDLPGYNRDVAPIGLSGFPPVVDHRVPVPPVTPCPPGRYPSTPYSNTTPHPPGYLPNTSAHTTILPLYNHPPHDQYPSHDAPWNAKNAITTTAPRAPGPSSYQPGQRSAQCKTLSEEDLQSLYKQVVFSAISSRQPLLQPKPDRDFTLRDCWVLIALSEQYDRSSASKEKWFELQAKFASATGRMVDAKLLRQKVNQGEKVGKVVEGWEDDEVGMRYKKEWERATAW
ncbi:hypothetical protein B0H65DRAFT_418817 [Neurospora tetraspora]|uniref:Myb-like domain-containing protein n=1 Tax=Neurospora tetraspora TaxID=94610 RepID=A0AAE0JJW7_9PEZI|nr:hypothetical protein B0H65DRAFT_418817 [Neurospora tetraspora]